ncbi:uncharacterized protein LOC132301768 [Cornus florida]|uniref:uncharacterized protein LOC132301768 n=1 Tax=Cornus florida TaxID=4283 RepID=UPI002898D411|nr:uncharacterized protein LOC132301768 [Cornus florida]
MPTLFKGNPYLLVADSFMDRVEKQLNAMNLATDKLKITLATYNFVGDAEIWWKTISHTHNLDTITYAAFKKLYYEKYFPAPKEKELKKEFDGLKQGNMTVTEYENKFISLLRFAPRLAEDEEGKIEKFVDGFDFTIKPFVATAEPTEYAKVARALQVAVPTDSDGHGRMFWVWPAGPLGERLPTAEHRLSLEVSQLDKPLCGDTPVWGLVTLGRVCRSYSITIVRRVLEFDLILLKTTGFDVILRMDWLSSFRAVIDCFRDRVSMCTPNGDCFCFVGDWCDSLTPSVYGVNGRDQQWFFLASLFANNDVKFRGVDYPVIACDFLDAFLEDMTELPPHREVKFAIDLFPGTTPISMALYRMTPIELEELKK